MKQNFNGRTRCKICNHPGRQAIDAMLLGGAAKYKDIIAKMKAAHPGEPELNEANLSRHWKDHVQTQPIAVSRADPETGEQITGYLTGHLSEALVVQKDAIPTNEQSVTLPDALKVIINAGVRNILLNPLLVGPKELVAAIEMARKMGLLGNDTEEFAAAWKEFAKAKSRSPGKTKRTRRVTVEETQEDEIGPDEAPLPANLAPPDIIEVRPVEWSEDDLKLLEAPADEE